MSSLTFGKVLSIIDLLMKLIFIVFIFLVDSVEDVVSICVLISFVVLSVLVLLGIIGFFTKNRPLMYVYIFELIVSTVIYGLLSAVFMTISFDEKDSGSSFNFVLSFILMGLVLLDLSNLFVTFRYICKRIDISEEPLV